MNILHYAMTFILNEEYLDRANDTYRDALLQTIYLREWAFWFASLINYLVDEIEYQEGFNYDDLLSLNEADIVELCRDALTNHLVSYHNSHGRNNTDILS